ncbi:hypothetical protein EX30DRAFT_341466 [Ascodesmis nigricans]|uniref:Uncharacterized protein n=1 Tax=Ascodesmis nigricans TaxID=341454 RepID=A0A4S2MVJ1_9PEZI|nr:hypothetical protein EX30DRAFT_341466 [Ascodesmis nigricans]
MFSLRQLVLFLFLHVTLTLCVPFFIKDQLVKCMTPDPAENELSIPATDIHAYGLEYCATLVNTTNPKYLITLDGQPSEIPQYYSGPWTKSDGGRLELCCKFIDVVGPNN